MVCGPLTVVVVAPISHALKEAMRIPYLIDVPLRDMCLSSMHDISSFMSNMLHFGLGTFEATYTYGFSGIGLNTTNSIPTIEKLETPSAVLETALVTHNRSVGSITWTWSVPQVGVYYFTLCFTEVEKPGDSAIREFNVTVDENAWPSFALDHYLDTFCTFRQLELSGSKQVKFSLVPTNRSTVGAILNSFEVYQYSSPLNNGTYNGDVNTLDEIAGHFNLEKEWMGDPCLPQKYHWDWVDCNQDSSLRIIVVYYNSYRLTEKSDVYSFEVVLMEIISGRHPRFVGPQLLLEIKYTSLAR
ncbi:putative leucine-rich repeat receptor-like protein kinase At2g19210 [Cryptomeria japonica]|uniref:putative leucine-rich repeat receptor-like protein kinase At2g19210 n=1 Tax=Cryptomeria japonica TaxID=3369 RepID=UPI0027DA196C|nr:putative leucine-rich repeat receptor-like protein kinase At2g19210 [Cryptomeria japonica]